jgi:fluoride exporter
MLIRCLLVLCGGAAGSLARYLVTLGVNEKYDGRFPLATFLINVAGSFAIGILTILLDRGALFHPNLRWLLVTGVLGGFTTFSSFEWETFALGRSHPLIAFSYCISSVAAGWIACWCGVMLVRRT